MKTIGLVFLIVCLVAVSGVSCNNETTVSECNLKTKGINLEIDSVAYQYSVEKYNGSVGDKIIDWTVFDVETGFSVKNLSMGSYRFSVRGITKKGAVMYLGSKVCFLPQEETDNITIVLYPQFDETNKDTTLKINLLTSDSSNLTANSFVRRLQNGQLGESKKLELSKCDTGFSSASVSLIPGYYQVSTFLYRNGVEAGGNIEVVLIPTGYEKVLNVPINPRSFDGFTDIAVTSKLTVEKNEVVTLGWVGEGGGTESNGYWMIGEKVVEDNSMYYTIPTSEVGKYTVYYYRGSNHFSCEVTVIEPAEKVEVYVLNFRCKDFSGKQPCIGYKDKTTNVSFSTDRVKIKKEDGMDVSDYSTLNLQPVYGTLEAAVFAEIPDDGWIDDYYGQSLTKKNSTVKKMIVHGDLSSGVLEDRFTALEELVLVDSSFIALGALRNLTALTTVYIIPPSDDITIVSKKTFSGSAVEKIVVFGDKDSIQLIDQWNDGTELTADDIVYNAKLPL